MPRGATVLASPIVALLLVAGCAPEAGDGPVDATTPGESAVSQAPTSTPTSTPSPEPSDTHGSGNDVPAFPESTTRQSGEGSKASELVLVDVRAAAAEGFDRIVLEFSGAGTPGWVVNYVDQAVLDGSGEAVDPGGRATLDIYASGTTWPASDYYDGPNQFAPEDGGTIAGVHVGGTFEGTTQVIAGIDGTPAPFRVFTLSAPSRLVVDVMDTSDDG